jgi:hypothetical protein
MEVLPAAGRLASKASQHGSLSNADAFGRAVFISPDASKTEDARAMSRQKNQAQRAGAKAKREAPHIDPLIYPRSVAAQLLSVSIATLLRMEKAGRLTPLKLASPTGQTFYRAAEIKALIGTGA